MTYSDVVNASRRALEDDFGVPTSDNKGDYRPLQAILMDLSGKWHDPPIDQTCIYSNVCVEGVNFCRCRNYKMRTNGDRIRERREQV